MTSEWRLTSLGDAGVSLIDCEHRTPPAAATGYPYIAIPELKRGRLDLSAARRITHANYVEWTRKAKPQAHDVILSRRCNPGDTAVVPEGLDCALGQNLVLLRADGKSVAPTFLRWMVSGPAWWEQVGKYINVGAVFDSLRCADVPKFELPLPPLPEQLAIAHTLNTFDGKIDLIQRMNQTLEDMARVLFKSWFVDFDPVRAKYVGRMPGGIDAETAKLFPCAFEKSEATEIPKSWKRAALRERVTALSGGTPSKSDATMWGGSIPWISPKVMKAIHADEADDHVTPEAIGNGIRLAPAGSTLVMVRGMGLHQEVRVSQATRDVTFNQDVKALVPREIEPSLLLFALLDAQQELLGKVESSGHGTGVLASDVLLAHPVTMPDPEVQKRLAVPFDALNERIASTRRQVRTLTELRDTLLPKLLSGALRIPDIEGFLSSEVPL